MHYIKKIEFNNSLYVPFTLLFLFAECIWHFTWRQWVSMRKCGNDVRVHFVEKKSLFMPIYRCDFYVTDIPFPHRWNILYKMLNFKLLYPVIYYKLSLWKNNTNLWPKIKHKLGKVNLLSKTSSLQLYKLTFK